MVSPDLPFTIFTAVVGDGEGMSARVYRCRVKTENERNARQQGANRVLVRFAPGYGYFAALEIEALAERHGRTVGVAALYARRRVQSHGRAGAESHAAQARLCAP